MSIMKTPSRSMPNIWCVCVCVRARARACACMNACVSERVCVCVCVRACVQLARQACVRMHATACVRAPPSAELAPGAFGIEPLRWVWCSQTEPWQGGPGGVPLCAPRSHPWSFTAQAGRGCRRSCPYAKEQIAVISAAAGCAF